MVEVGSRVREDNRGDSDLLEMCWERGRKQVWLFFFQFVVKGMLKGVLWRQESMVLGIVDKR